MNARFQFPRSAAAGRQAYRRHPRTGDRVTGILTLALGLPLAAMLYETGGAILELLVGALLVATGWTFLFARLHGKGMNWHAVPTAIVFSLIVPPGVPLWQALLALSFGVVIGEQIFGGRGYSFLHPATVALAFLFFSFPTTAAEHPDSWRVAVAVLAGVLLLLATGLVSWRILLSVMLGFSGWMALKGLGLPSGAVLTSGLALGVAYLVCEPTCAAVTNAGRWTYGLLVGALIVVLGEAGQGIGSTAAVVFAALLGSVFAPLIDRIVIHINVSRRRRRQWPTSIP